MTETQHLCSELADILADPVFVRSHVMSRLIRYLVERNIAGESKDLNSYAVAVDGLGRSAAFDPQIDSYARVQVTRLRKLLDAHYAAPGNSSRYRITVEPRTYEVRLVENDKGQEQAPESAPILATRQQALRPVWFLLAGLLFMVIAGAAYTAYGEKQREELARWRKPDFPSVAIVSAGYDERDPDPAEAMLKSRFASSLSRYEGIRISIAPGRASEFTLQILTSRRPDARNVDLNLLENASGRIIWTHSGTVGEADLATYQPGSEFISDAAFRIAHPSGAIHSFKRRRLFGHGSPYGCWLRFMGKLETEYTTRDARFAACAEAWHNASPEHPLAAALLGWNLLDQSIGQMTMAGREAKIRTALGILEAARDLNSESAFLQLATMRAYGFAGEDKAMKLMGQNAMALNPENPDVEGMVGTLLAMQGDPQGEVLLHAVIARHRNPPPRYFIGVFIGAMMRDDARGAGAALEKIRLLHHDLPVVPVMEAALLARTGHVAEARRSWAKARSKMPMLRLKPELLFERMPLGPRVRQRFIQWATPAFQSA